MAASSLASNSFLSAIFRRRMISGFSTGPISVSLRKSRVASLSVIYDSSPWAKASALTMRPPGESIIIAQRACGLGRCRACAIFRAMALSRRQFFRRFLNPGERTPEQRQQRYSMLESYVRTNLLPYDFGLTDQQYSELISEVRSSLANTNDEELFSSNVYRLLDGVVDTKIQPWREAYWLREHDREIQPPEQGA